jgi:hypothetical protein
MPELFRATVQGRLPVDVESVIKCTWNKDLGDGSQRAPTPEHLAAKMRGDSKETRAGGECSLIQHTLVQVTAARLESKGRNRGGV